MSAIDQVKNVHTIVAKTLASLKPLFIGGARLTFVMRVPNDPDGYMVISDDDNDEVIAILGKSKLLTKVAPAVEH